jgi:hypothetical protein
MSQWNKTILEMSVLRGKHSFRSGWRNNEKRV